MATSYEVLKNRLTNGQPFTVTAALERITNLADTLMITTDEKDELTELAKLHGSDTAVSLEERVAQIETASLQHDLALAEIAGMLAALMGGVSNG